MLIPLFYFLNRGIIRAERIECINWAKQLKTIPDFYLTDWQKAQCKEVAPELGLDK